MVYKYSLALLTIVLIQFSCQQSQNKDSYSSSADKPIQLHPENPHYFLYKGETKALITSAEHYGAVLNLDFDFEKYLQTLAEEGMNYTRIFGGIYFEKPGAFNINNNTLAPIEGRAITPWVQNKEGQYDLSEYNDAYFERLKSFMTLAQEKDIIVEVTLFSSIYQDFNWARSPQNPANNVNLEGTMDYKEAQVINNKGLLPFQKAYVAKMVTELNEFDNFFFEIQNEPWSDHNLPVYNIINKEELVENDWQTKADFPNEEVMAWQKEIAKTITETEANLSQKHLIAQNYTNYKASIPKVDSAISIINFHYAWPEAVDWNYHYNKVIGFDESGFAGSSDKVYRRQAWRFMLSGGGLFNNLDYSFYVGKEDGTGQNDAPGGGSKALRAQLKVLSDFLHSFPLEKMIPAKNLVSKSPGLIAYALTDVKLNHGLYLQSTGTSKTELELNVMNGFYQIDFIDTLTGEKLRTDEFKVRNGKLPMYIAIPNGELALKIIRK